MDMRAQARKFLVSAMSLISLMSFRGALATRNLLVPRGMGAGAGKAEPALSEVEGFLVVPLRFTRSE
jgi:hypothetical protein